MFFRIFILFSLAFFSNALLAQQNRPIREYGLYRVAAVTPVLHLGNPLENADRSAVLAAEAVKNGATVVVFPELNLTGYTMEDYFLNDQILAAAKEAVALFARRTSHLKGVFVISAPYAVNGRLFNTAFVISGGKVIGAVPKTYLPNYAEFRDKRWFDSGKGVALSIKDKLLGDFHLGSKQLFKIDDELVMGIEICEDLWAVRPVSGELALLGANLIVNPSASNDTVAKGDYRRSLVVQQSATTIASYAYAAAGIMESTKDIAFGGHSIIAEDGQLLAQSTRFNFNAQITYADVDPRKNQHERRRNKTFGEQEREVDHSSVIVHEISVESPVTETINQISRTPFVPADKATRDRLSQEIIQIRAAALARRLLSAKSSTMIIGLSGGSDSTAALIVMLEAAKILGWSNDKIIAVTMPGLGTTKKTKSSAEKLARSLGLTFMDAPIVKRVNQMFKDLNHDPKVTDITYENSQARDRTTFLMNLGNKHNGLVIGTGDLSEMCLGWCTYNGDQQSGYGVNVGVPKTLILHLIDWWAKKKAPPAAKPVLKTILATKISPELLPPSAKGEIVQSSEEKLGPYLFHDFIIYYFLRYGFSAHKIFFYAQRAFGGFYTDEQMLNWMKIFFERFPIAQFKRDNIPGGTKVGSVSISPRGDLRLPSEADCSLMLTEINRLMHLFVK